MLTLIPTNALTAICGVLAIVCYAYFSRRYERVIRYSRDGKTHGEQYLPYYSAIILYAGAAAILFLLALAGFLFSFIFVGWNFSLPVSVDVVGHLFSNPAAVKFALACMVFTMSVLYAMHIVTEALARRTINMGAYALVFQIYVLVIAALDWAMYRAMPELSVIIGGTILLAVGLIVSVSQARMLAVLERKRRRHYHPGKMRFEPRRLFAPTSRAIRLGLASALACGAALYVDGEIGRNYILKGHMEPSALTVFLGYEMLTFLIPAMWSFLWLSRKFTQAGQTTIGDAARAVWEDFRPYWKGYLLASLCSAGQFVFSVLALSLPGPRFVPAMILAAGPALTILFDLNLRKQREERGKQVALAIVGAIGFVLVLVK